MHVKTWGLAIFQDMESHQPTVGSLPRLGGNMTMPGGIFLALETLHSLLLRYFMGLEVEILISDRGLFRCRLTT